MGNELLRTRHSREIKQRRAQDRREKCKVSKLNKWDTRTDRHRSLRRGGKRKRQTTRV